MTDRSLVPLRSLLAAVAAGAFAIGGWNWGCEVAPEPEDSPDELAVLEQVANQVIVPALEAFTNEAAMLEDAMSELAAAPDDADALAAAQTRFRAAFAAAQVLEVMQIGPAAGTGTAPAGEGLRDKIYSWPTANSCTVERNIVDQVYATEDFFVTELVHAYGLDALEHLLFVHAEGHTCPPAVQLDDDWNALGFAEIEQRRADYGLRVAAEVRVRADELVERWSGDGGFAAALGQATEPYASSKEAMNDLFRAMFYIDLMTKDRKLGDGIFDSDSCPTAPCPELFEAPASGAAVPAFAANLRGLRDIVRGGDGSGPGFDDLLVAAGHPEVAEQLLADIDDAIATCDGIDGSLQELAVDDPDAAELIHLRIKTVTDTLKGPFVMILALEVPSEGAGDND